MTAGIPWLGFVVFPTHRRVKARKAVQATRRLSERFEAWRSGRISFGEFEASVQGWINHVRYADSWGLRRQVLDRFVWSGTTPEPEARASGGASRPDSATAHSGFQRTVSQ